MADSKSSWVKLVAKFLCLAVVAGLILFAINAVVIDSRNSIAGNTMRDLYAQERIDLVFLGSSTVYESCVPEVFDTELDIRTFNAATPAQTLRESYYQLKEVCRFYQPKHVLLGVGPQHLMDSIARDSLSASYLFDNMRWSPVKFAFMADAFDPDDYPSALFPVIRLREELTAADIKSAVASRLSALAGAPKTLESDQLRYAGKGYVANLQIIENGTLPEAPPLGFSGSGSIDEEASAYLSKIERFCRDNDMHLTLFQTPLLPGATEWVGDYAAYHDFLSDHASRQGVGFVDFNYLKPEIITYEDEMFSDLVHATETFAQQFSKVFAETIADGGLEEPVMTDGGLEESVMAERFFTGYDTYRELYDAVASTWVVEASASGARVASVGTAAPAYRVTILRDDEAMDAVYATDWQIATDVAFPPLDAGDYIVTVEARPQGDEDAAPKGNWDELHVD
jgi:hypothetical protein